MPILHDVVLHRRSQLLLFLYHFGIAFRPVKRVNVLSEFMLLLLFLFLFIIRLLLADIGLCKYVINEIDLVHALRILAESQRRGECIQELDPLLLIVDLLLLISDLRAEAHAQDLV